MVDLLSLGALSDSTEVYGGPYLDRIEFIDYGTDPSSWLAAIESEEIDVVYESLGDYISLFDDIGLEKSEVVTASTIVIRPNQQAEVNGIRPYEDVRVRRALAMGCLDRRSLPPLP